MNAIYMLLPLLLASPPIARSATDAMPASDPALASGIRPAQTAAPVQGIPVTIGVFTPYMIQPGVRIGLPWSVRTWPSSEGRGTRHRGRTLSLFAGPRLSFFTRPGHHRDLMLEGEVGARFMSHGSGWNGALSLSFGYLLSSQVIAESIDLATGSSTRTREWRHHITPAINVTVGKRWHPRLGWFATLSLGDKRSFQVAPSLWYTAELGVRVRLGGAP